MKIFKYQHWHLFILLVLVYGIFLILKTDVHYLSGEFLGVTTKSWLLIAILSPIVHQFYVVLCWRYELFYSGISKLFGQNGFLVFKIGFAILILSRIVTVTLLAISNMNSIDFNMSIIYVLIGVMCIPCFYLFYSVKKYFGIDRAFGIDHFYPEKIKNEGFVKRGIFKYTSNGMYIYGFLLLWIPGLLFESKAALLVALFNHIYIWVHYFFTELPDMKVIYEE